MVVAAVLVGPLGALPLEVVEVVLELGMEEEVFVAASIDECFPKVAPKAPPRTPPRSTRRTNRPMTRFLREKPRDFRDTAPSSRASESVMYFSCAPVGGGTLAPPLGTSAWSNDVGLRYEDSGGKALLASPEEGDAWLLA